ncbi:MAG: hypothetical protein FD174_2649 [Geobacteraceae bacterium]|nr:MAG: hypothetical protein FD174_2649 [Geobacteraceae bacterium]
MVGQSNREMTAKKKFDVLSHEDLVKLSHIVYKLLRWDGQMSWEEALNNAYYQVLEESVWSRSQLLEE